MKSVIQTRDAPEAIGTYSQGIRAGNTVWISGQIGLDPASMQMAEGIDAQTHRVFRNLAAVGVSELPHSALVEINAILHG